ncbi:MAG: LysR family transcriptional regulator, partial [Firmicutes bacterium]|nr:LysR family transcriptional regulator [Bacillota bacterium]
MDINHIECFLTVARTLNFSEAARRSYISQSMVSRYIDKLEKELGAKLFLRTNKEVELTAQGRVFLPYAASIIDNVKKAAVEIDRLKSGYSGKVKIGYEAAAGWFAAKCAAEFSRLYPAIAAEVCELHGEDTSLSDSSYDCIFLLRDMIPDNANTEHTIIYEDTLSLVTSSECALKRYTLSELKNENFILLSENENPILYMEIMDIFRSERISPHITARADSVQSVLISVSAGLGISLLPTSFLEHITSDGICVKTLDAMDTSLLYAAAWRSNTANNAAKMFIDIVKKHARMGG